MDLFEKMDRKLGYMCFCIITKSKFIVASGFNVDGDTKNCFVYNYENSKSKKKIASVNKYRQCGTMKYWEDNKNQVFIAGGGDYPYKDVEIYDSVKDQWKLLPETKYGH